jgi:capsular exopolysaccharide synthesis family protein
MDDSEIDIRGILGFLRRRLRLIALTFVVVVGAAGIVAFTLTPIYSAAALILVDPSRKNLLQPETQTSAASADNARVDSEVEILRSDSVLLKVIAAQDLISSEEFGDSVDWRTRLMNLLRLGQARQPGEADTLNATLDRLRDAVSVQRRGATYLIAVQARAEEPETAARLANAIAEAYIEDQIAAKIESTLVSRDILQSRIFEARDAIAASEGALDAFLQTHRQPTAGAHREVIEPRLPGLEETDSTPLDLRRDTLGSAPAEALAELYALRQDAEIARSQYQQLLSRAQDLEAQANLQIADSRIVSPALAPQLPSFPNKTLILALAALGALGLGVALAFLYENLIGGFTTEEQMESVLRFRVASAVPRTRPQPEGGPCDLMVSSPLSAFAEAIRRIRTVVDQQARAGAAPAGEGGRVIMLSSTVPGEGKSTLSLALARSYALSGRRTLLVDCDLRKPSIHRQLGIEPSHGLHDYLRPSGSEPMSLGSVVSKDQLTEATVILGARKSDVPTDQLLAGAAFGKLIEAARSSFEIIVLDTPPIDPIVDALYVAPFADSIVFVTKWASTAQSDTRKAIEILTEAKRPETPIVTALNQQHEPKAAYDRKYGGYYQEA